MSNIAKKRPSKGVFVWEIIPNQDYMLVLAEDTFDFYHESWRARKCSTWGQINSACDGDNKDDDSEAEYWVSDDEAFHIGYLELDDPDLDSQFQCWPPSIEVVQYHDCEEYDWLNEFNTFVSSFAWNDSISELSIKDKDKILQAIEENGYEARHEPALMDLCTPRLNGLGHWGTHPLDQVHQERIRKHNQETDNGRRSSPY